MTETGRGTFDPRSEYAFPSWVEYKIRSVCFYIGARWVDDCSSWSILSHSVMLLSDTPVVAHIAYELETWSELYVSLILFLHFRGMPDLLSPCFGYGLFFPGIAAHICFLSLGISLQHYYGIMKFHVQFILCYEPFPSGF